MSADERNPCPNVKINEEGCSCPNTDCDYHGFCCACVEGHRSSGTQPLCLRGGQK